MYLVNLANEKELIRNAEELLEVSVVKIKEIDKGVFNK